VRAPCLRCKGPRDQGRRIGRGLCGSCYCREYRAGTLDDWPRTTRARGDVVEVVAELLAQREDAGRICERIGMTPSAVARVCYRAGRPDLARPFGCLAAVGRRDSRRWTPQDAEAQRRRRGTKAGAA
jgi:hypothetical protein